MASSALAVRTPNGENTLMIIARARTVPSNDLIVFFIGIFLSLILTVSYKDIITLKRRNSIPLCLIVIISKIDYGFILC